MQVKRTDGDIERIRQMRSAIAQMKQTKELIPQLGRIDENCKLCWGRGYIGFNHFINEWVLCSCLKVEVKPLIVMEKESCQESPEK